MTTSNTNNNSEIDNSFRGWVKLMWGEGYLIRFILFLLASILIPSCLGIDYLAVDLIFGLGMVFIAYFGFYRRWIEYINNKTS
jgi:hypothetical protein